MIVEKNEVIHPNDLQIINNLIINKKVPFVFRGNSTVENKKDFYLPISPRSLKSGRVNMRKED